MFKRMHSIVLILLTTSHLAMAKKPTLDTEPVSAQTEAFVRDIQKELGMDSYVICIKPLAEENAMVLGFGKYNSLYLNEKWLSSFSEETQRFIIGHEFMHMKRKHIPKRVLLSLAWPSVSSIFIPYLRKHFSYGDTTKALFMLWYSRVHEKEADLKCAQKLKCAQGGIEFFEALIKEEGKCPRIPDAFLTHPSHQKRIKQLRKLMASPKYQAA